MTAILGYTDIVLESPDFRNANEFTRHAVVTIKRNGEHLLSIINDILDFSKIEAKKLTVERIPISPIELIEEVVSQFQARADERGLALKIQFERPIPGTIQSDPTRLRQILFNLVGNAVKFTVRGGVHITTRLVRHDAERAFLWIDVSDTGIGIAEADMASLFSAFSQADSSTTRRFGGTGLGLAISRHLAEALGGGITVTSRLGEGSTFSLAIETGPLDDIRLIDPASGRVFATREQAPAMSPSGGLHCHILLAEDGPDNQRLIKFHLERAGATVDIAENGDIAVTKFLANRNSNRPYDLVLMDMQMPVRDGYETTRILREFAFQGPIIALTANAMLGDRQKCLEVGCDEYASKPIRREELIAQIRRLLSLVGDPSDSSRSAGDG
ncbi:MAG: ATP-binding protein [Planctomycetota bacterium]